MFAVSTPSLLADTRITRWLGRCGTALALFLSALAFLAPASAQAAGVTRIWGTYGGFWDSSAGVTADDSNVLLGFTVSTAQGAVNAGTYSTGVNDTLLTANSGVTPITPVTYVAFNPSGVTSNSVMFYAVTTRWLGRTTDRSATDPASMDTPPCPRVVSDFSKHFNGSWIGIGDRHFQFTRANAEISCHPY